MKTRNISALLLWMAICCTVSLHAQVLISNGAGTSDPSAQLEIRSTGKGLLLPRMDFNDRPQSPTAGLIIFVTTHGPKGNNAVYVYNGTAWVRLSYSTYLLGDAAQGGIIFNIDSTGQHGYACMNYELGNYSVPWGCDSTLIGPLAQGTDFGTGKANTHAIDSICPQVNIAARVCSSLNLNGYSDWFLPSHDELDSIHAHKELFGLTSEWYWSSSEYSDTAAWIVLMDHPVGQSWITGKSWHLNFRCIRQF